MPQKTWTKLPPWALLACRDILRAATANRRLVDILNEITDIITGLSDLDLAPSAALYIGECGQEGHRLLYHRHSDDLIFPLVIDPENISDSFPQGFGRASFYPVPLVIGEGERSIGSALFFGRTAKRMSAQKQTILMALAQEIARIIINRGGPSGTLIDLVELSTDEIYIFDPLSLAIVRANHTASIRTGHSLETLSRMTPAALKVEMSEAAYRAQIEPLLSGRCTSICFDARHRRRNGTVYPVKVQAWRIRSDEGDFYAEVAVTTADQRKAFGLLEQVFDAIPGGIGVFDKRSRLLMANRRLYDLMNIPPEQFPPGSRFEDILRYNATRGEYGDGNVEAMVRERVEQAELGLPYSFERERASGKVLAVRSEPLSGGGYVLSYTDITLRKRAEKELIRDRDELEATVRQRTAEIAAQAAALEEALKQEKTINAMQRQFVAMTSHEFRTPLAIIDGAAQRLMRKKGGIEPDFLVDKTHQIRAAVMRMVDLMESILSAGRIDTGRMELTLVDCSLKKLIEQAIHRQRMFSQNHRFQGFLEDLPDVIRCDALAISQVVTNLLGNAVKYAPRAPDVTIRGWREGEFAMISVQDQGVGIDADDIPKLFQPYFRARTSTGIAGTGIGLSLVKQVVTLHGGDIVLQSRRGHGSTFTIRLPIRGPVTVGTSLQLEEKAL
ncbi:Signal transduction histidine kinase [Rhizobium sp. RU35A]|uniref:sensor histidine kinase n=1 Tax=Rhizobium sp. RU35A TaxID=1907414 RepID=UPI0009547373|nr:PAS-domain containing protein [Rhizobium sp. RU35A]SIP98704.1 Signal transduction histidine kinase [Rhizobium sp. RU35A]